VTSEKLKTAPKGWRYREYDGIKYMYNPTDTRKIRQVEQGKVYWLYEWDYVPGGWRAVTDENNLPIEFSSAAEAIARAG